MNKSGLEVLEVLAYMEEYTKDKDMQYSEPMLNAKDLILVLDYIEQLKKQLEYIRSGEYYNQLRFERDMLQNLVDTGEISAEDKEFIDCTHRNTELLEENKRLKDKLSKIETLTINHNCDTGDIYYKCNNGYIKSEFKERLLDILKGE